MGYQRYSEEFKKSAVEKLLHRGSRPIAAILAEVGVSNQTLYQWRNDFANLGGMKKTALRPQDRSPEAKLKVLIEFESLPEEKRGEFLRKEGLHVEHLEAWRKQWKDALTPVNKQAERLERAEDRRKIRELERDLRRKDAALAETTALLA
ncbi:MAG: transposase [Calothrix sp. SM1_5_4]|nr:transposase [Calothrix sp. SM1_5_4]